jgi:mitochondrial GTPase 1
VNEKPAIYVVDTPGVMLPNVESVETGMRLALTGAIKDDVVGKEVIADYMLFKLNQLRSTRYVDALKLPQPTDDIDELLAHAVRFCSAHGKEPDVQRQLASEYVLKLFRSGAFGQFTLDPIDAPAAKASTTTDESSPRVDAGSKAIE